MKKQPTCIYGYSPVLFFILFLIYTSLSGTTLARQLYESVDKNGNKVYSDKIPESGQYLEKKNSRINALSWKKTNKDIYKNKKPTKRTKKNTLAEQKKQLCNKLKVSIKSLEQHLRQRLAARVFEKSKIKLRKQRGEYRKEC